MATAYLGLGSNLGERLHLLRLAREALDQTPGLALTHCSPLYETDPVGGPPGQPPYLNAVAVVEANLAPRELLEQLLEIEAALGRERGERWGARTVDLDLLLFDDLRIEEPGLIVPHPRLHLRRFVLQPLGDLVPNLVHPVLGHTVARLLDQLGTEDKVTLLCTHW